MIAGATMISTIRQHVATDLDDNELTLRLSDISPRDPEGALFWE